MPDTDRYPSVAGLSGRRAASAHGPSLAADALRLPGTNSLTTSPAQVSGPIEAADPTRLSATPARQLRWWVEVSTIAAFYGLYSPIRDLHGANTDNVTIATHNAYQIIRFERHLHIFVEAGMQHGFIHARLLISGLDDFYGAAHFLAVAGVLIGLFLARPDHYGGGGTPWHCALPPP